MLNVHPTPKNVGQLYNRIKQCANMCGVPYLPENYRILSETLR